jgi:hypothetical protein
MLISCIICIAIIVTLIVHTADFYKCWYHLPHLHCAVHCHWFPDLSVVGYISMNIAVPPMTAVYSNPTYPSKLGVSWPHLIIDRWSHKQPCSCFTLPGKCNPIKFTCVRPRTIVFLGVSSLRYSFGILQFSATNETRQIHLNFNQIISSKYSGSSLWHENTPMNTENRKLMLNTYGL